MAFLPISLPFLSGLLFKHLSSHLDRKARGAIARCIELKQQRTGAKLAHRMTCRLTVRLMHAKRKEQALVSLSKDVKTLLQSGISRCV